MLVAGGFNYHPEHHYLRSAEVYDPLGATWSLTRSLHDERAEHTATLLPSGNVLVAGGRSTDVIYNTSCEEYDPISQTRAHKGPLNVARAFHTATLLLNGKVLATGGRNESPSLTSSELFDPNGSQ